MHIFAGGCTISLGGGGGKKFGGQNSNSFSHLKFTSNSFSVTKEGVFMRQIIPYAWWANIVFWPLFLVNSRLRLIGEQCWSI